jgi:hypothetical protein
MAIKYRYVIAMVLGISIILLGVWQQHAPSWPYHTLWHYDTQVQWQKVVLQSDKQQWTLLYNQPTGQWLAGMGDVQIGQSVNATMLKQFFDQLRQGKAELVQHVPNTAVQSLQSYGLMPETATQVSLRGIQRGKPVQLDFVVGFRSPSGQDVYVLWHQIVYRMPLVAVFRLLSVAHEATQSVETKVGQ